MKKIIFKTLFIFFVFILCTFIAVLMLMNSNKILSTFDIVKVSNEYTNFEIDFTSSKAALKYKIEITDEDANIIFSMYTKELVNRFNLNNLKYGKKYFVMVYAYDKDNNFISAREGKSFVFDDPTFSLDNNLLLNNRDYILKIDGNISNKEYKLSINKDNKNIYYDVINSNEFYISKEYYYNEITYLDISILCNDVVIDKISLFNNMNPISDINIISPLENANVIYNDLLVKFDGGNNASKYIINIYKDNNLINSSQTNSKNVLLSKTLFESNNNYRIEIIGVYDSYYKSANVDIVMSDRVKLKPVYISNNWNSIKYNSKVILTSPDDNVSIYYTLNGDDPLKNGILYTGPITIDQSVLLRCVATGELKENSIIKDYQINVGNKTNLKIYISPSNQGLNEGVHSTGFTTEKNEMNDIANYVIEELKNYGVIVYRNNPLGNINQWNRDANYLGVDMKLAIHSNASLNHSAYGTETWINSENSDTYSLANAIQNSILELYPYKDRENYNRGVRYALGEIGEANDDYVRMGILVEVAHHDDLLDATFIMNNKKQIGYNIADAILRYYQVID